MSKQITALLDLGNTRYKWTYLDEQLSEQFEARPYPTERVSERIIGDICAAAGVNRVVVCSVRDANLNHQLEAAFQRAGIQVRFAAVPEKPPFPLAYEKASTFGIDRYCQLLAANARGIAPVVIVSAGTAVTFDALDKEAGHLGGVILPGLMLQRRALNQSGSLINAERFNTPQIFGISTENGIAGGTLYGLVAAIDSISSAMREKLGPAAGVILSGGDALLLSQYLPSDFKVDESLLFQGLAQLD
ncbi:MAG: type III pantothenate kinase [Thiotrichales bacterium]